MFLRSVFVFASIFIIGASFAFVTIEGLEIINIFTNGTRQLAQYPLGIYNKIIRIILTIVIPVTIISYYPIDYLTNQTSNILYVFIPLLSIIPLIISICIFKIGINKYMNSEDSVKVNTNGAASQKIPEGEYGVYAANDTKNPSPISGAQNRNTWYVGYHIPEKDSRLKEKLAGRAKSLGLHFSNDYPDSKVDAGKYVWLKVMGDWEP